MYKNIAATLQTIERAQRHGRAGERSISAQRPDQAQGRADGEAPPSKLGPLQKIIAFGPFDGSG